MPVASRASTAADDQDGVHALLAILEEQDQAGDETDQAVAHAPLRGEAEAGQGIAKHVADCAGEEADHRAKGDSRRTSGWRWPGAGPPG